MIEGEETTLTAEVNQATRQGIFLRVQDIFRGSGILNVTIVDGFVEGGANIYFANELFSDLHGRAFTGIDRFNERLEDRAVVFFTGDAKEDAEAVTHALGHSFGMRRVNPSITVDPPNEAVMD